MLQTLDNFCKVLVKKTAPFKLRESSEREIEPLGEGFFIGRNLNCRPPRNSEEHYIMESEPEEPLVDIFDEGDHVRILVQCRCREQQVTFHPNTDGIIVCREECQREKGSPETCRDVCRKLSLRMDDLQLENMEFVIAKCNNNNTLEALIPKLKK
jgi:hypothetical protein